MTEIIDAEFSLVTPDFYGTHLWHRLVWAKDNLDPVQSDYRVVFEDDLDGCAKVMIPDPNWMACALHGGILPPVERYHEEARDENQNFIGPDNYWSDFEGIPAMTEEEAIEYLIKKDVPRHVWQDHELSNRPKMVICKVNQLPATREYRNAWKIAA